MGNGGKVVHLYIYCASTLNLGIENGKTDTTPSLIHLYNLALGRQTINKKTSKIFPIVERAAKTLHRWCDEECWVKGYFTGRVI